MMKLLNRGKREIHGQTDVEKDAEGNYAKDKNGVDIVPIPFVFKPNTSINFDDKTGMRLKKLFPKELITMEDLERQFDGSSLVKDNAPVPGRVHQNEASKSEAPAVPAEEGLSPEEKLFIEKLRMERAQPVKDQEPEENREVGGQAPLKKKGLLDSVKSAMHGGA